MIDLTAVQCAALSAVQEAGSDGLVQKRLDMPRSTAHKALHALEKAGLVFLAERNRLHRRWFADQADAQRWLALSDQAMRPRRKLHAIGALVPGERRKGPSIVLPKSTPVVDASRARFDRSGPQYTHNHRYQCGPGEQPHGAGFAAAGIGRYL